MATKNTNTTETMAEKSGNSAFAQMEKMIKKHLAESKRVRVRIPKALDVKDTQIEVGINGYIFILQRGVDLEVPVEIEEILKNGGII